MELKIKKGDVYHIELNSTLLPDLPEAEDYAAYFSFEFFESLPGYLDVKATYGHEIGSYVFYLDEYTCKKDEDPVEVIKKYWDDAMETLIRRGVFATALDMHKKELEESYSENRGGQQNIISCPFV